MSLNTQGDKEITEYQITTESKEEKAAEISSVD